MPAEGHAALPIICQACGSACVPCAVSCYLINPHLINSFACLFIALPSHQPCLEVSMLVCCAPEQECNRQAMRAAVRILQALSTLSIVSAA